MVGVEGRVRSVAVHGGCLLGALRRKREDGKKVEVDVDSEVLGVEDMVMYFVVELNNSQILDLPAEAALKRRWGGKEAWYLSS